MKKLVELEIANIKDAVEIHKMQKDAFAELLERYQDFSTNPGNDTLEKVSSKLQREDTKYYFIKYDGLKVGVIHIKELEPNVMNLKTIYVMPEYQGLGIAQAAIKAIEEIWLDVKEWRLDTILQEAGNCHLYEKMGYLKTGEIKKIKEGMDLVYYSKTIE